jgi:hypothetical protein
VEGKALILPGGTMNVLAKRLHGEPSRTTSSTQRTSSRCCATCHSSRRPHRAFCALIVGPAAAWAGAREAVRYRRVKRFVRARSVAWGRTWSRGVTLFDGTRRRGAYKALLISPEDGWLRISAFFHRDLDAGGAAGLGMADGQLAQCADGGRYPIGACDGDRAAHAPRSVRRGGSQIAQPRADQQRYEQPALRDDG